MNTPTLLTERLILRKFTKTDLDSIFLIFSDKEVNTFLPWYPLTDFKDVYPFYEEHYSLKYILSQAYAYAICLKEDNIPIGYINVDMDEAHDFGYGLRKDFWNRGITSEAAHAVIEQLKNDNISYITATHDVKNPRSGNIMKKLGMKYCYSYEELWQPKNYPVIFRMYQLNLNHTDFVYMKYWNQSKNHFIEKNLAD